MAISFEKALSVHESALHFRAKRANVLANNLVNADTPGFKARDIRFKDVLDMQRAGTNPKSLRTTHGKHISSGEMGFDPQLMYRIPIQPSVDGNTVDEQSELARYTKNALDFQTSFRMLNGRLKGLRNAIRGE